MVSVKVKVKKRLSREEINRHMKEDHGNLSVGGILRSSIFGANDGLVSTLALVAGVVAAGLTNNVVILAALAEIFAGAISMAVGEYISTKSEIEFNRGQIRKEKREIEENPELGRREVEEIYKQKGFTGKNLKVVVDTITSNKKIWLDTVLKDELGLHQDKFDNPIKTGTAMGISFLALGMIPVLPFFFLENKVGLVVSFILTLVTLFIVGSLKTKVTVKKWWKSGLEQMLIGVVASLVAYLIGYGFGLLY